LRISRITRLLARIVSGAPAVIWVVFGAREHARDRLPRRIVHQ
jgi:hypothetical protein